MKSIRCKPELRFWDNELQHASPQQKAAIVREITATGDLLTQAEAQLPALQTALDACQAHHFPGGVITGNNTIGVVIAANAPCLT